MMTFLTVNQSEIPMPKAFLAKWVKACERELKKVLPAKIAKRLQGELVIVFLDRGPAKALNRQHRGRDYATDVLSFASESFGELVLCPQVLKKQAKEHDLSFQEELGYLILHGILHLLGFDHEKSEKEARRMFKIQDGVFERLRR